MPQLIPIEEIYDAATDDECLERLALSLTQRLGARSGVVHWHNLQTDTGGISISGYFSEDQMADYDRHFSDCDLWAAAFAANGSANRVWSSEQLVSSRAYEGSRIYNDWIRAMGDDSFRCLGAGIRTDVLTADIGFHRARSQPTFDEEAIALLNDTIRHLERMMTIRSKLVAAEQAQASNAGALSAIGYGLITIGAGGRVIHCNRAGEAVLARGDGLQVRSGILTCRSAGDQKSLSAAIERALARQGGEASALRVARARGGHYELSLVSVQAGLAGRQVLLTVTDPDSQDVSLAARLRTLYRLSAAEAEIAIRISEGASLADLSEERSTAIGTIRNQTKAVAEKLGCGRQAEIVALVRSLPRLHVFG